MKNIEIFNLAVAEIFGKCYEEFPRRIDIDCLEIAVSIVECLEEKEILERDDIVQKESEVVAESVEWLLQAGYLWCQTGTDDLSYHNVTLSPMALQVLDGVPDGLVQRETLGQRLSRGVGELGKQASFEAVKIGLSIGAKLSGLGA